MSFLKRFFTRDASASMRGEYEHLLAQARKSPVATDRARLLNLAGDLALNLGDDKGALAALGEALDVHLRDRDYHSARAVARKLLRVRSSTIRVRSTLAWLAIAQDLPSDARVALDLYVTSLKTESDREFAIRHLTTMVHATDDRALRASIADHLALLGHEDDAKAITDRLAAEERGETAPPGEADVRARWEEALARMVSPDRR